ncbi:hypothetical protein AM571_PC00423 (plasmid) [Rhizobium etli 8C-3]|uniref:Uncharacterized protein n=1 Tax=Rhizobium etli 8C-3 TaxID=538025 RepID=A0A1L5PDF5_RHIET|nr:hypothetical protein AM571_PC00423 [Rhizobium etli 8C-3]
MLEDQGKAHWHLLTSVGLLADRSKGFRTERDDVVAVSAESMPLIRDAGTASPANDK